MQRAYDFRAEATRYPDVTSASVLQARPSRLSHEWRLSHIGADKVVAFGIGVDSVPAWLDADGAWCARLAECVLGAGERELWVSSRKPEARRREWLLGRAAAKDAAAEWVWRRHGVEVAAATFEILPDADGRPVVTGLEGIPQPPIVSISHAEGAALAIAGGSAELEGIGIDLERRGRMTLRMESLVFTPPERALLEAFEGEDREAWGARLWSAKEAVAKFTACTVVPTSRALRVVRIDGGTGLVLLEFRDQRDEAVIFHVSTGQHGPWVVATCLGATRGS